MIQIPMTAVEFGKIEAQLQNLNPGEGIALHEIGSTNGNIVGSHPINWSADYLYSNGELRIHGHGMFSGKIESGIQQKLDAALAAMRGANG